MRLQKLSIDFAGFSYESYHGSAADAKAKKKEILDTYEISQKYATIEMVNVEPGKEAMLEFINSLAERGNKIAPTDNS